MVKFLLPLLVSVLVQTSHATSAHLIAPQIANIGVVTLTNEQTDQQTEITRNKTIVQNGSYILNFSDITWDSTVINTANTEGDDDVVVNLTIKVNDVEQFDGAVNFTTVSGVPQTDISLAIIRLKEVGNNTIEVKLSSPTDEFTLVESVEVISESIEP